MAQVHFIVPQLPWMQRTPYTACLRPARSLETTHLIGKVSCKECRRIWKAAKRDGEHPLFYFFHQPEQMEQIGQPRHIWEYVKAYTFQSREAFHCLYANTQRRILELHTLSVGSMDGTLVRPGMVFKPALELCASFVYLVHNHPSGEVWPSKTDIEMTSHLIQAGKYLGIEVTDHLVCSPLGYVSMLDCMPHIFT